jgi:uncharacterized MAPEG superfamily protein
MLTPILNATIIYSGLMLFLLFLIAFYRSLLNLKGEVSASNFAVSGESSYPFTQRICRAHANCYEWFPIFLGILVVAFISGKLDELDSLAYYFIGARLGQSLIHLISTSNVMVKVRFAFALIQLGIQVFWIYKIIS